MTATIATRWISRDLSHLYTQAREARETLRFDVVIVGSGYGGAMAAAELAGRQDDDGRPIRVLVLERGKEYVPGMFPSSLQEMPTHVRVHRCQSGETTGWLDGLFDVRIGPDVCALVGNGLGGGSLINAGVMEMPDWSSVGRLPATLANALTPAALNRVRERLGARTDGRDNTIPGNGTAKTRALQSLDPGHFRKAAITVEFDSGAQGSPHMPCTMCGDCMTGCNVGAKKSLDTTLLLEAAGLGAQIFTSASVVGLQRAADPGPWELSVVFTGESLRRRHPPLRLLADRLILAAGTLGSPEILMRSQSRSLRFSPRLGEQFSCNGDNILAVQETGEPTHTVAHEHMPLDRREVGPTITGIVDVDRVDSGPRFLIQEFAVPAALKRVFDELVTTFNMLHVLPTPDREQHVDNAKGEDPLAVHPGRMGQALLLGLIGHDESCGRLTLPAVEPLDDNRTVEGRIHIAWPGARKSPLVDDAYARAEDLIRRRWASAPVLPNPLWRMLPEDLDFVFRAERGPLLTVHPLGGCPIGPDRDQGVVDEWGRVYDFSSKKGATDTHPGLWVLDGSILPSSLGVNPALTIAAVAERAAARLAADAGWVRAKASAAPAAPAARPRSRQLLDCTPPKPVQTQVELIEKLCGPVRLAGGDYMAELTLRYVPHALDSLSTNMHRELVVTDTEATSSLRVYRRQVWDEKGIRFLEEPLRARHAELVAPVRGTLSLLQREPSSRWWRILRGAWAYLWNRGWRDLWSSWAEIWRHRGQFDRLLALASRAGEVRRFDYALQIGSPQGENKELLRLASDHPRFEGCKRFTYSLRGNPWRQLMELQLSGFLGAARPMLELDGRFMARQAVPLARIVSQQTQVHALAETASFALYCLRLFVNIHVWSFRAPDLMPPRQPKLLPAAIRGLPEPEVMEIELEPPRHGIAVRVRLTRYKGSHADDPSDPRVPLVMIHGYSASGTTFTHEDIPEPMARYFWQQGRDIWILDLRTSAGMPSAVLPWNFEDAALADIPVAIGRIRELTGKDQVDVFAHCIGAVMLSMALLTDGSPGQLAQINAVDCADGIPPLRYVDLVKALPASIRRIVLSQKGPALVYSDGNVLRAYLMRLLRRLILPQNYQFRVPPRQVLAGQALDRLLSSLPYPDAELARENPWWPCAKTPWVGFRHRMDALYARDFSLKNIADRTLGALEDLFGPLNLDTVAQAVHFARYNRITNGAGRNCFVTISRMQSRWPTAGTLSIHGEENGLADVRTLTEMQNLMNEAEHAGNFKPLPVPGLGHQDCLIGTSARDKVFIHIEEFLQ
jgi:cholesterol oxidase